MTLKTLTLQPDAIISMCAVCISDRSGGQIALLIIVSSLVFLGIANYGIKPTFHNTKPLLEVHIFNFSREIYGKRIAVSFKQFIRHEKKFDSIEKLKDQIIKDIKIVKNE